MCWSAKWLGEDEVSFSSIYDTSRKTMIKRIWKLINEADAVVHYNGSKFDMPTLNKEFLLHNLLPPSPVKQIDLLRTTRQQFKFPSNKLDYIAQTLGLGNKVKHTGHQLWIDCMNKDPAAWELMKEYNINDVILLENVYNKLRPWIKNHPNVGVHDSNPLVCPTCGGHHYQSRGTVVAKTTKYRRFCCTDCGSWFRGHLSVGLPLKERFTSV